MRNAPGIDYALVRRTCMRLFAYRQLQQWPPTIEEGKTWEEAYRIVKEGLDVLPTAGEAVAWANLLVQRIDAAAQ